MLAPHKSKMKMKMKMKVQIKVMIVTTLAVPLFISGCVFYPKQIERYSVECDLEFKMLVLETKELKDTCSRPAAKVPHGNACLMAALGTTALPAIVPGSVAIVGSKIYWLEKDARCI